MSKKLQEVYTSNGNPALNNLELLYHIQSYDFKTFFEDLPEKKPATALIKSVCYSLALHRNNTTSQCNVGGNKLSKESGCSLSSVKRTLRFLKSINFIIIINDENYIDEHGNIIRDGSTTNRYYFMYDMNRLSEMLAHDNHEITKTNECEYVEKAVNTWNKFN